MEINNVLDVYQISILKIAKLIIEKFVTPNAILNRFSNGVIVINVMIVFSETEVVL